MSEMKGGIIAGEETIRMCLKKDCVQPRLRIDRRAGDLQKLNGRIICKKRTNRAAERNSRHGSMAGDVGKAAVVIGPVIPERTAGEALQRKVHSERLSGGEKALRRRRKRKKL